jgi:hypothetical protein
VFLKNLTKFETESHVEGGRQKEITSSHLHQERRRGQT